MIKDVDYKPFNLEYAKAGAPVMTDTGRDARIVAYDRVGSLVSETEYPLVVLIDTPMGEGIHIASVTGVVLDRYTLVMKPLYKVEGKPAFHGDEVEVRYGSDIWRKATARMDLTLGSGIIRWPWTEPIIELEGKELHPSDIIWFNDKPMGWKSDTAGNKFWAGPFGVISHIEHIKKYPGLTVYRRTKPILLDNQEVTRDTKIWFNRFGQKDPRSWVEVLAGAVHPDRFGKSHLESIQSEFHIKRYSYTEPKWISPTSTVLTQKYQAILYKPNGQELSPALFNSPDECKKYFETVNYRIEVVPTISHMVKTYD